jgi:hypothetical protein
MDALEDIARSWKSGDPKPLRLRFPSDAEVGVFSGGKFSHGCLGKELAAQVGEGVTQLKTLAFEFDKLNKLTPMRYFAAGKHRFSGADGQSRQVFVSYVLEQIDERWMITEYGGSETPVTTHSALPPKEEAFGPGL